MIKLITLKPLSVRAGSQRKCVPHSKAPGTAAKYSCFCGSSIRLADQTSTKHHFLLNDWLGRLRCHCRSLGEIRWQSRGLSLAFMRCALCVKPGALLCRFDCKKMTRPRGL